MVNNYTNQQIRSTTIRRQRVVIIIGSYEDRYNRNKTTGWNDKQRWKRSKWTMEAIKSELRQLVSTITFSVSLLYSPIRSNKRKTQQTMGL